MHDPSVNRDKIVFPPLHIKLGLMKQFLKALNNNGKCFQYLICAFSNLYYEKIKAGVFNGAQIRLFVYDEKFVEVMNNRETAAWLSFVAKLSRKHKSRELTSFGCHNAVSL